MIAILLFNHEVPCANHITIPWEEPRRKLPNGFGSSTITQSKSHKGHKKSTSSIDPLRGPLSSNLSYMVEALKLLTERSNTSASVQCSILATIEYLKLHMMKLVADVTLIRKQLSIAEKDEESSTIGAQEEPIRLDNDVEFFATIDEEEEEEEEEKGEDAAASATSDDV
ncbi:hypothetical protein CJ030_MR7G011776 [Morella rubra]|uniref:Uncharacterized protein n=1 Tax=Morella rubra TaxID=262757 RepID=A0A6A1V0V9_9ROSI|nr:hypothetical protein CJ030_MR7G011776 [Morella rubra]